MVFPCAFGMGKNPTYGRCFWSLIVACPLATPIASVAQISGYSPPARVLSEVEAVRLGLARPEVEALLEGEIDVARSDVLVAKRLPNPALPYSREDSREVVKRWSERMQAVADIMRRQEAAGKVSA